MFRLPFIFPDWWLEAWGVAGLACAWLAIIISALEIILGKTDINDVIKDEDDDERPPST